MVCGIEASYFPDMLIIILAPGYSYNIFSLGDIVVCTYTVYASVYHYDVCGEADLVVTFLSYTLFSLMTILYCLQTLLLFQWWL